jgi:hypothetical protein
MAMTELSSRRRSKQDSRSAWGRSKLASGRFIFINPYADSGSARVSHLTWDQLLPYVWVCKDVAAPASMSVNSVVGIHPHTSPAPVANFVVFVVRKTGRAAREFTFLLA